MSLALALKVGTIQALGFSKLVCCVTTMPPAFQIKDQDIAPSLLSAMRFCNALGLPLSLVIATPMTVAVVTGRHPHLSSSRPAFLIFALPRLFPFAQELSFHAFSSPANILQVIYSDSRWCIIVFNGDRTKVGFSTSFSASPTSSMIAGSPNTPSSPSSPFRPQLCFCASLKDKLMG
jgi:hypothetical protein